MGYVLESSVFGNEAFIAINIFRISLGILLDILKSVC